MCKKNSGTVLAEPAKVVNYKEPVQAVQTAATSSSAPEEANNTKTAATSSEDLDVITSPMVGTFYTSGSPGDEAFVQVGSSVSSNTVVCVIEAMKLFNDITADMNGEIAEILVSNGELVEYGQPLFKVRKK
ncbi:acetyl-CoA carboxylase biotin carboxyl carrier protein [Listeria floridensis]|uniref:acetyl-CoA carboxylase biotin carboxyl carrier protein n=1 Tax=Listeria floridensis TaxID=1494962 RepID=UPI003B983012